MKKVIKIIFTFILVFAGINMIKADEIEEGNYYIESALSNYMVIDLYKANVNNATNIELYQNNFGKNQQWKIQKAQDGYYYISSSLNSNKVLDVAYASKKAGANVEIYDKNAGYNQMWKFIKTSDGYYYIQSKCNGLNIDVTKSTVQNGTNIEVYYSNNSAAQKFRLEKVWEPKRTIDNGEYIITSSINSDKALDIYKAKANNGANIQIYNKTLKWNQIWKIEYLNNGYYKIANSLYPDYVLDVSGNKKDAGTNIELYKYNGGNNQQWAIKDLGNGNYTFISKLGNAILDLYAGNTQNENNIQIYPSNNGVAQKFKLETVWKPEKTVDDGNYIIASSTLQNKVLDIYNGEIKNNSNVEIYTKNSNWNQIWKIEYLNNGYYKIANAIEPDYVLDVSGNSYISGTNVGLYKNYGSDNQQWAIQNMDDGSYKIISKLGNAALTINGSEIKDMSNINISSINNSSNQKFKFEKTSAIPLKNGIYKIINIFENKLITLENNHLANNANIVLAPYYESNGQKWLVSYIKDGYYKLSSSFNQNYVIDIASGNSLDSNNLQLYKANGATNQVWYIKFVDGNYVLSSKLNSKVITNSNYDSEKATEKDIEEKQDEKNTNLEVQNNNNTDSQKFNFEETEIIEEEIPEFGDANLQAGYYTINPAISSSLAIDVHGAQKFNGTNVEIYSSKYSLNQIWYINKLSDGYYAINSSMNPNISLDVADSKGVAGTNIQIYKNDVSDAQKWIIKDTGDGYVTIVSKLGNLALDLDSINVSNGTNVYLNELTYSKTQKFKLTPYTGTKIYKGIDVSSHNGNINWQQAASNIDFAILRLGYGGVDDGGNDSQFVANAKACEDYNIPYGVYLYSYAIDSANDTQVEVNHIKKVLPNYHPNLGTKVFFDMEDADGWKKKYGIDNNNALLTAISNNFCTGVQNSGYSCGIYANANWLNTKLDAKMLADKFTIWVAIWPDNSTINNFSTAYNLKPSYTTTDYKYWQFTSNGRISGINGSVDLNLGYDIFD